MKKAIRPKKSGQIPATKIMLDNSTRSLKKQMTALRLEMRAGFKSVDARFNEVDARFNKVDARFNQVDAKFLSLESKIEGLIASVNRTNAIVEEQNARNVYVLDGYTSLYDSQGAIKARVENLEKSVFGKKQI